MDKLFISLFDKFIFFKFITFSFNKLLFKFCIWLTDKSILSKLFAIKSLNKNVSSSFKSQFLKIIFFKFLKIILDKILIIFLYLLSLINSISSSSNFIVLCNSFIFLIILLIIAIKILLRSFSFSYFIWTKK